MTTLQYSSGDEIRPGDKVECADGMEGKVVCTLTPGEANSSDPLSRGFMVEKSDGTMVLYQPSEPSVKLISHLGRKTSKTMNTTIKKKEFLQLMEVMGSHSLYYPEPLTKRLHECGISADVADGQGLLLEGHLIPVWEPECGESGISPLAILTVVYEITTGNPPHSEMTGTGFRFRDVMRQLAKYWSIDSSY